MPHIQQDIALTTYNTFGISAIAKRFISIQSVEELQKVITQTATPFFVLGGGSNILLSNTIKDTVLKNEIRGKSIVSETDKSVITAIGGGENWHEFVLWCIERGFGGVENLSLIPGTVGAAPIQNIGAYGVELKDVFIRLEAVELASGSILHFDKNECDFGYRDSIFKRTWKGKLFISRVYLELQKKGFHQLNTSYGAIQKVLSEKQLSASIQTISDAVIAIRQSKLPDPTQIGNAGSFFKNPIIPTAQFEALQNQFSHIVSYPVSSSTIKIPAGWLIEQCGWKGKQVGNTGCYQHQALVIVNHGGATGEEIYALSESIIESVRAKFGISLEREVNVLGFGG